MSCLYLNNCLFLESFSEAEPIFHYQSRNTKHYLSQHPLQVVMDMGSRVHQSEAAILGFESGAVILKPSVEVVAVAARSRFHGNSVCLLSPACAWSRSDAASVKECGTWRGPWPWHPQPHTMWHGSRECVCPATVAPGLVFQLPWQPYQQPDVI